MTERKEFQRGRQAGMTRPEEFQRDWPARLPEPQRPQKPLEPPSERATQMPDEVQRGRHSLVPGEVQRGGLSRVPEEVRQGRHSRMPEEVQRGDPSRTPQEVQRGGLSRVPEEVRQGRHSRVPEEVQRGDPSRTPQEVQRGGLSRTPEEVQRGRPSRGPERKAPQRGRRARMPETGELRRADADTVMFASLRAVLPHATRENRFTALSGDEPGPRSAWPRKAPGKRAPRSRRTWVSLGVLALIMALQAALTLRMSNTAFEDEGLYLYVGHLEIGHLLHGSALQGDYASYFSGAPVLYPVLGALADSIGGLAAARALSLLEMLAVTGLLYSMTRRLFNERVGLCAAVIFAVTEPTLFLGNLATYDATALVLLALAAWLAVRFSAHARPLYLLAAPALALAVATKYATLLFVPSVIGLAGLAAVPKLGRKAVVTSAALGAATVALLGGAAYLAGPDYLTGFKFTTLDRFVGTSSTGSLLWDIAQWIGVPFLLAVIGAVGYAMRPFTEPGEQLAPTGGRVRRALLGGLMAGSALLAPVEQIRIHTETSLWKHVGFGLLFAAPIAGVGLARVIGDHFRRTQVGIAVWGASLAIGMTCANNLFNAWPNSSVFVADMAKYVRPGARYLVEVDEVPIYYLRANPGAQPRQFTSTYFISYATKQGTDLTGNAGYVAAIKAGYFNVVAFNYQNTPAVDAVIAKTLAADPDYNLAAVIPNDNDTMRQYIWVKNTK